MDIREVRYFVSVYENGSLTAAAHERAVTVQAVSKAIAELEQKLGTQLFVRNNHGASPTAVGCALYRKAKTAINDFDSLDVLAEHFPAQRSDDRLSICLCANPFPDDERVFSNMAHLIGSSTGLSVAIFSASGPLCFDALRARAVDAVATVGAYRIPDAETHSIGLLPTQVIMASDHPLAARGRVPVSSMAPYRVLRPAEPYAPDHAIIEAFATRGLTAPVVELPASADRAAFFHRDHGLALGIRIPGIEAGADGLAARRTPNDEQISVPLCLVMPQERRSGALRTLIEHLPDIFRAAHAPAAKQRRMVARQH